MLEAPHPSRTFDVLDRRNVIAVRHGNEVADSGAYMPANGSSGRDAAGLAVIQWYQRRATNLT
jgi:hypothetical protein